MKSLFFKLCLQFLLLTHLIGLTELLSEGYRFKLDIGNPNVYCPKPDYTCPNGKLHYVCKETNGPSSNCVNYKPIMMTEKLRKAFVEGTNGIRNKVATDLGLANMNLVYWSDELSGMAARYLRECVREYDNCLIIGEKFITVSQNVVFYKGQITDRWPGRMVRHWYVELGHDTTTWRKYKQKHLDGHLNNITNMVYPMVEFMGCGGARMFNGYFIVCYYHPQYIRSTFPANFSYGKPCTNCSIERKTCSKTFAGLCGVDFEINCGTLSALNTIAIMLGFLVLY